jgi:hypothetical protein
MERSLRVVADGQSFVITGVDRNEWEELTDACPACGGREFDHLSTSGGHYGVQNGTAVLRSDLWDADRSLFTRCRECGEILHKHPAFDLLFGPDADAIAE